MKLCYLTICLLAINWTNSFSQTKKASSRTDKKLISGLFSVIADNSKKVGLKLENSQEYYALIKDDGMTLKNIDTVYSEFNKSCNCFLLTIKFNQNGQKALLAFTTKYAQHKVGLVVNSKLIVVPTIFEPITKGGLTLASSFTKTKIESIVLEIKKAIQTKAI
jgi:preprotein translocase subunit SecD